jgi:hypothetical protein
MRSILAIAIVISLAPLHARAGEPEIRTVHGAVLCTTPFQLRKAAVAWFTEGFDTRDLKEAKALLEQLAS